MSHRPDLINELVKASLFVSSYAHALNANDLFKKKTNHYEQFIFESVDNCLDCLMPRVLQAGKSKVEIQLLSIKEICMVSEYLNDFLTELYKFNREFAIKRIYNFFRYSYDCIKPNFEKRQKRFVRYISKLKNRDEYKREMGYHLNFLYQVAAACVSTALVNEIDKNVLGNVRQEMLDLALTAAKAYASMGSVDAKELKELEIFSEFQTLYTIIKKACGIEEKTNKWQDKIKQRVAR